jgi:ubiquinol-cytochrome c reductase iron-sulfur subunit
VPFVSTFAPSERAKAAGAPVQVDISACSRARSSPSSGAASRCGSCAARPSSSSRWPRLDPQLADPNSERTQYPTPAYAKNEHRSIKPEFFVGVGICSHLGCSPSDKFQPGAQPSLPDDWQGGFLCPCHGSTFDMAGRVFKNKPRPTTSRCRRTCTCPTPRC